jgi:hypothetical protein
MQLLTAIPVDNPRANVMIGIGAGDGTVEFPCVTSLFTAAPLLYAARVSATLVIEAGNPHVDDMRNGIVATFLASDCDQLVFIDEDVGFEAEDLLALILTDRPLVGGIYPKKEDKPNFPVHVAPETRLQADADGLVEVHGLPTGFMKIQRHVLQTLADAAKSYIGSDGREYHIIFERMIAEGRRWSGDYAFCRKWAATGGKMWTDPRWRFTHTGKKTWEGALGDYWREQHGIAGASRDTALAKGLTAVINRRATRKDFDNLVYGWGNTEWGASVEFLEAIYQHATGNVIECGSGLSTLVLAAMGCTVTALEHDEEWAAKVAWSLHKHGLGDGNTVCHVPLKGGWYDYDRGIADTLVIDGPPRDIARRDIALERIEADCIIWDDYEATKAVKVFDKEASCSK